MRVSEIMTEAAVLDQADDTLVEAARKMWKQQTGSLLVVDGEDLVGIITERDVLRECLYRSDRLAQIPVREAMTKDLIIGLPHDELGYTMGVMTKNRVRHLPVMDGGKVVGMISIGDVVKATLDETEYENRYLKEYIQGR